MESIPTDKKPASLLESLLSSSWRGVRDDLVLYPGPLDHLGEATWQLEDPISGQYYQFGQLEADFFQILRSEKDLDQAINRLHQKGHRPSREIIIYFLSFLQREKLALSEPIEPSHETKKTETPGAKPPSLWARLLYGYVYLRIPLLRPDNWLEKQLPRVKWLWSKPLRLIYLLLSLAGLLLVFQGWDLYVHSVSHFFTLQGGIIFFLCLASLKIFHEFCHAFVTKSMGLHVRSMGVVLIVLWPILYTDATEAWRLEKRSARFKIDSAGMFLELVVAGLALFFWGVTPEGYLKSAFFYLSGTSVVSSLFLNLNPLMRFDGYYMLMDLWGIDNLQPRAFALMNYKIRQIALDWKAPPPESHRNVNRMILYAAASALYRIVVVIGIGLAVYYLFFKTLGIILLAAEILVFIFFPIWRQMVYVAHNRKYIGRRRRVVVAGVVTLTALFLLSVPLPVIEIAPGLVLLKDAVSLYTPQAGQLASNLIPTHSTVKNQQLIAKLEDPVLSREIQNARFDLAITDKKIFHLSATGEEGGYRNWLLAEKKHLQALLEKLHETKMQLAIRSPLSGTVVDIDRDLNVGQWVSKNTYLATVARPPIWQVKAFVHENAIEKVRNAGILGAEVHFSDLETPVLQGKLLDVSAFPVGALPNETLYDFAGGSIVSQRVENQKPTPRQAYFTLLFEVEGVPYEMRHGTPCWVWIRGTHRSILWKWVRDLVGWLNQEGFYVG